MVLVQILQGPLEDIIHTLFVCKHPPLQQIRSAFFQKFFTTYLELRGVYDDPGVFFKDLLVKEKMIGLLGKLANDILEVFYSKPMLNINPALTVELKVHQWILAARELWFNPRNWMSLPRGFTWQPACSDPRQAGNIIGYLNFLPPAWYHCVLRGHLHIFCTTPIHTFLQINVSMHYVDLPHIFLGVLWAPIHPLNTSWTGEVTGFRRLQEPETRLSVGSTSQYDMGSREEDKPIPSLPQWVIKPTYVDELLPCGVLLGLQITAFQEQEVYVRVITDSGFGQSGEEI
ncbi:hypothetical protein DFH08DRAFT_817622 [Mycena albidolilacea]|uniref:Uncharacterized protein n=1 Tax=Mycena albidolilacea TaxID=1033008 RepID=A0AAD6ZHX5_9AGAR|nr:hypothetical protein DFH08DRAFT_817622 [Mycena albidolilacea]